MVLLFSLSILFTVGSAVAADLSFNKISFPTSDGGQIIANLYGNGDHAVVLAHGAVFDKESWHEQAEHLVQAGFAVLSIDFRGYGDSTGGRDGGMHDDVLGAIEYLYKEGAKRVSVIGGSMGGGAAARAAAQAGKDQIHQLILLAHAPIANPEAMVANKKFFIVSQGDGLYSRVKEQYQKATEPKRLEVIEGNAHAQHIFKTSKGQKLTDLITEFLSE